MHEKLTAKWSSISLRSKITGVTVLLLTVGLLVSGIGTMAMLKQYVIQQVDQSLQTEALTALNGFTASALSNSAPSEVSSEYFVALYDANGNLVERTWRGRPHDELPVVSMPLDLQAVTQQDGRTLELYNASHDTTFLAVAVPFVISPQGTYGTMLMAVSLKPTENTMATYLTIFLGFGAGVVLLGALLTRLLAVSYTHLTLPTN